MGLWKRGVDQRHAEAWHFMRTGQFTGSMAPLQGGPGIQPNASDDQNRITENSSETIGATGDGAVASDLTSSSECVDSSDCASGWRCSGGECRPPRNSAGGGRIANNDQGCGGSPTFDVALPGSGGGGGSGNGSGGGGGSCGAGTATGGGSPATAFGGFGRQDTGGCTKSGCGGEEGNGFTFKSSGGGSGGSSGGGSPNACCGQSRCCRVGAYGAQCFCGDCPPDPPVCNTFCGAVYQSQGESSAGCGPGSQCSECSTCNLYGSCVPVSDGSCRCAGSGCGDCQSCTESGTCRSSTSDCGPQPSPPPGSGPPGGDPGPPDPGPNPGPGPGPDPGPDPGPPEPPPGGCGDCQVEVGEGVCNPDPACEVGFVVELAYVVEEQRELYVAGCTPNGTVDGYPKVTVVGSLSYTIGGGAPPDQPFKRFVEIPGEPYVGGCGFCSVPDTRVDQLSIVATYADGREEFTSLAGAKNGLLSCSNYGSGNVLYTTTTQTSGFASGISFISQADAAEKAKASLPTV